MRWLIILVLFVSSVYVYAEEKGYDIGEVVVTAGRFEESMDEVGSSVSVINSEDIGETKAITVSDMLRTVPGVTVSQSGGLGGHTSVFIRGAESYHTLVMIDGVEVNDPIDATRSYNWADLLLDDIDRIEIVRGPQSALYGSDAIGGVVNVITKEGSGKPKIGTLLEGGSYSTFRESIYSSGGFEKGNYSISLMHVSSDGFSSAKGGNENDGYKNTTFSGKAGFDLFKNAELYGTWRYINSDNDLDYDAFIDDPNYSASTSFFTGRAGLKHSIKEWWKHDISFSYVDMKRDYRNTPDVIILDDSKAWYDGTDLKGEWQHTVELGEISTLVGGVEYQEDQGKSFSRIISSYGDYVTEFSKKALDTFGLYLQDTLRLWERLVINVGGRYEDHEAIKSHFDYKAWVSYAVPKTETRLKCSIGTGFKAPSLFQLYSIYGNQDLKPEEADSYDMGFEQPLFNEKITAGLTYFHNKFKDLIDFEYNTFTYQNISRAKTDGVEAELMWKLCEKFFAGLTYTYLQTKNEVTGLELLRRPMHTYGLTAGWYPNDKWKIRLNLTHVGERDDIDFRQYPAQRIDLDPYTKVDLSVSYQMLKWCEIFARAENILDEDYEEVYGYETPRLSGYGGLKAEF